eukprot:TRINITY_DN348_c0_g3_i1.p1 TRINITY_DN348_c0_g3~~TRINITY_DN348_c0_g3_i1.p1  ORF type:complete len:279 (+),score=98.68 TRINITY_DN348_c0_g3_i1:75-911(+)
MCSLAQTTPMAAVEVLMEFFCTRLLLKRYRKGNREGPVPMEVRACEAEFRALATRAVVEVEQGAPLDAMVWCDLCSGFSAEWMTAAHWVSPKKFREHLTATIGAAWVREEEVPADREQPPVDLKWYKAKGCDTVESVRCPCCDIQCNSPVQYRAHVQGRAHKAAARKWKMLGRAVEPVPVEKTTRPQNENSQGSSPLASPQTLPSEASSVDAALPPLQHAKLSPELLASCLHPQLNPQLLPLYMNPMAQMQMAQMAQLQLQMQAQAQAQTQGQSVWFV